MFLLYGVMLLCNVLYYVYVFLLNKKNFKKLFPQDTHGVYANVQTMAICHTNGKALL